MELFIQVCLAIHHAHQRGIIHRDIKPSNILVSIRDDELVPKVIDFGIAKATAASSAPDATLTRHDQIVGTPAYMPPEIAAGKADVDTRSDIHSLGVLLYELLIGHPPLPPEQLKVLGIDEIRRRLVEEDPPKPSSSISGLPQNELRELTGTKLDKDKLIQLLKGDLDWITMKAIDRERDRRYQSAYGLARDVERYLNDQPVNARPPDRLYNFSKLIKRHKISFLSICVTILALVGGIGASTVLFLREKSARTEQEQLRIEADTARSNEVHLRERAEDREKIANAAVQINYGNLEAARLLLDSIPFDRVPASLEAAQSFSIIGNLHVQAGRWSDATNSFAAMARALILVDPYESTETALTLIPAAAMLCQSKDFPRYELIRDLAIEHYSEAKNPTILEQVVKASLIVSADNETLENLQPMVQALEGAAWNDNKTLRNDSAREAWVLFSITLANYRERNYLKAHNWANRTLDSSTSNQPRLAGIQSILAMIEFQLGNEDKARAVLDAAFPLIQKAFSDKLKLRSKNAYWFDWIIARILYNEALELAPGDRTRADRVSKRCAMTNTDPASLES